MQPINGSATLPRVAEPFNYYRQLLAKVDAHANRVTERHADALYCQKGCTACCRQDLSVARVEADHITDWLERHTPVLAGPSFARGPADEHAMFSVLAGDEACSFLGPGGACQVYPVRPIICRTHGLPVLSPKGERDVCPLNFAEPAEALASLEGADLLGLESLNTLLAAVDHAYVRETGASSDRTALSIVRTRYEVSTTSVDVPEG